jgi:hypothetical protein
MTKAFLTGVGDKVKVFVALLPKGSRTAPVNGTLTVASGGAGIIGDVDLGINASTIAIAEGTPLVTSGGAKIVLTQDLAIGDTTLFVRPLAKAVAVGETMAFVAKTRLLGGTQADLSLGNTTTDVLIFEDPGGYSDGAVTGSDWSISWSANELLDDTTFDMIEYNARNANSGQEIYIWHESPTPTGFTTGRTYHGPCIIEGFDMSRPSDGLLSYSCTFKGRGTPNFDYPA